LEEAVDLT